MNLLELKGMSYLERQLTRALLRLKDVKNGTSHHTGEDFPKDKDDGLQWVYEDFLEVSNDLHEIIDDGVGRAKERK